MSISTDSERWEDIDSWWGSFVESTSVVTVPQDAYALDHHWFDDTWQELDSWWQGYVDRYTLPEVSETAAALDDKFYDDGWEELDPWWHTFSDQQQADALVVVERIEALERLWNDSDSRFDSDPLTVDWTSHANTRGPLRPNQEENWSQWLAHLLRSGPPSFVSEVFNVSVEDTPREVQREDHLPAKTDKRPDRYADILLQYNTEAISIEIKKGDTHYEKTTHTAELIEAKYTRSEWTHYLLVPKYKLPVLRESFDDRFLETGSRPVIDCDGEYPISIVYWQDISAAIRECLLTGESLGSLWEASAFVFATLIEQKILGFNPLPEVTRLASANSVIDTATSLSVAGGDVEEQLNYLQSFEGENDEH